MHEIDISPDNIVVGMDYGSEDKTAISISRRRIDGSLSLDYIGALEAHLNPLGLLPFQRELNSTRYKMTTPKQKKAREVIKKRRAIARANRKKGRKK